jgi:hypothetical protein
MEGKKQVGGTHYLAMGIQPWDVIDTWPLAEQIGFYRGNLLKYSMRAGSKGCAHEDLDKATHYAAKLQKVLTLKEKENGIS